MVRRFLHLELTCRADAGSAFARDARSWLTEARAELFRELSARLPDAAVLRWPTEDYDAAIGPPGATWAQFDVYREPTPFRNTSTAVYSPRAWERLLATMEAVYPFLVRITMMPLDTEGRPVDDQAAVVATVRRDQDDPRWVRFIMEADQLVPWYGSLGIQDDWIRFAEDWAARLSACYGHISDDADTTYGTALEMATQTPGIDPSAVPRCHEVLRGYSWVTICAPELAQRLGGVGALAASGAFHQVRALRAGQVLLRATPLLEQYEGAAVERVFRVLAPVLLPGRADPERAPVGARLVLDADAGDYRH